MGDRRFVRSFVAALALIAPAALTPIDTADAVAPAHVVTFRSTYYPGDDELAAPTLVIKQGGSLTLTNLDAFAAHGLSSDQVLPNGERLFTSGVLNLRQSAPVEGVEALPPGSYPFHCAVHEDNMHGALVVL